MLKNKLESSKIQNNKHLTKFVLTWHCLVPLIISLIVWIATYGHSNGLREFLVFSGSHLLMLCITVARLNFNADLKDELLRSYPQKPVPEWFKVKENFTGEEI